MTTMSLDAIKRDLSEKMPSHGLFWAVPTIRLLIAEVERLRADYLKQQDELEAERIRYGQSCDEVDRLRAALAAHINPGPS